MRDFALAVALCSSACAARQAREAQRALIGRSLTGADGGLSGTHAACAPIVRGCLEDRP